MSSVNTVTLHPEAQMVQHSSVFLHSAVLWCAKLEMGKKKREREKRKSHMGRIPESVLIVFWHRCESEVMKGLSL